MFLKMADLISDVLNTVGKITDVHGGKLPRIL